MKNNGHVLARDGCMDDFQTADRSKVAITLIRS